MNTREEGYYWVKKYPVSEFELASFRPSKNKDYPWLFCHSTYRFAENEIFQIHETRILPPQN